jgi:hypothetical protein
MDTKTLLDFVAAGAKIVAIEQPNGFFLEATLNQHSSRLVSQRGHTRVFKTLDALVRAAKEAGCHSLEIRLTEDEKTYCY